MPEFKPFSAIRYDFDRMGEDISHLTAPPYDVLGPSDKETLLAKSDRNIVAVDLPHVPPHSKGPDEAYEGAANRLNDWLTEGTLVRESAPAIYLYQLQFEHEGKSYTRQMLLARVRLHPFSDGVILPHEETFGGPKEDRLALMKATQCNLSPVFALFADPQDRVRATWASSADRNPNAFAKMDGGEHRLWIVTDQPVMDAIASTLADSVCYIADGHHRYITALNYRDWFVEQQGGSIPDDHPANFVLLALANMNDPGCLILPYHRALAHVESATVLKAWSEGVKPCPSDQADLVLVDGRSELQTPLRYANRDVLVTLAPGKSEAWRQLDAAYLHRYLLDELLHSKLGSAPEVRYQKSAEDAKRVAREESGVALLVNATPMAHLKAVSGAGDFMPPKSTCFFPKIATGLVINPLT